MTNPKSDLATELGKLVNTYTWLVADFFLFLLLATFFLGYKDFDPEMQRFVRGAFIFSMWFFCVSRVTYTYYYSPLQPRQRGPRLDILSIISIETIAYWRFIYLGK